jgi:tetratricopeptide (TPR) repeat protein
LSSAIVLGREADAIDAARFIRSQALPTAPLIASAANRVLRSADIAYEEDLDAPSADPEVRLAHEAIRHLRARLVRDPRNAIAAVDLARQYSLVGLKDKAVAAIRRALLLAPDNRFVVRSAARLYVHFGDPERAHSLFVRRPATLADPWLLSTEISVAAVAGRTSRHVKLGREMILDDAFGLSDLSELAGAVGTVELGAGETKKAKKFFRKSLLQPTDNSVAQATWATGEMTGFEVDPESLRTPRAFEARTREAHRAQDWHAAVSNSEQWLKDEPFSSRPATLGSYWAAVALQDFKRSERIARYGLQAEPTDPLLINNLAVALAKSGRVDEAEKSICLVHWGSAPRGVQIAATATKGLILFRLGSPDLGRTLYREAIDQCDSAEFDRTRASALLHLAVEEANARTAFALDTAREALDAFATRSQPDLAPMADMLRAALTGRLARADR